jgi:hypothetical protein
MGGAGKIGFSFFIIVRDYKRISSRELWLHLLGWIVRLLHGVMH